MKNKKKGKEFKLLQNEIRKARKILISTHALPDGDGLGAEHALYHYLARAKKHCKVYNPDPLPPRFQFLDPKSQILLGPQDAKPWESFDLWVIVDTNDPRRLGSLWEELSLRARRIIFLDHHPLIEISAAQMTYPPHATILSDTTSSSIGELLYHLFDEVQLTKINRDVALGLYVSVMTDTNSFRYARTTPLAHQIAGEMIALGVNPEEVYQSIFSSKEASHLQLLGKILQGVREAAEGKLAWVELKNSLRKKHKASVDDTQSFLNLLLLLRKAEVVCLFREEDDKKIRVSIKSKGRVPVHRIAQELGGGGHEFAAGFSQKASMEKTVQTLINRLTSEIEK